MLSAFASLVLTLSLPAADASVSPRHSGSPPLRTWKTEEQGASSINWRIVVHPTTGFVYAANSSGLLEFDGVRWRLMPMPRDGSARAVVVGPDGRVWAAGSGQLVVFEPAKTTGASGPGDWVARSMAPLLPATVLSAPEPNSADAAAADSDVPHSALATFMGTTPSLLSAPDGVYLKLRQHVVRFDAHDQTEVWKIAESAVPMWVSNSAVHLVQRGKGIQRLASGGRMLATGVAGEPRVLAAGRQLDGQIIWLTESGPWRLDGTHTTRLAPPETTALLAQDRAYHAAMLPDGRFAYATGRNGVVILDSAGAIVERIDRARGLATDRVNDVCTDPEGGLWIASHTGLVRVQRESPFASHGLAQGLRGSPRTFSAAGERLYVAHSEGLSWRDGRTGQFESVRGFGGGMNQVAADGQAVIASGGGFFSVTPDGSAKIHTDTIARYGLGFGRTEPATAFVSTEHQVWLARNTSGEIGAWTVAFRFSEIPTGVNGFFDDGNGRVWMSSRIDAKIRRADLQDGLRPNSPITTFGPEHGLPAMVAADKVRLLPTGGALFVVSTQGAWRWNAGANRFVAEPRLMIDGRGPDAIGTGTEAAWLFYPRPQPRLRRISVADGVFTSEDRAVPELAGLVVNSLGADEPHRTLWIAGQGQLVSYDLDLRASVVAAPFRATVRRVLAANGEVLVVRPSSGPSQESPAVILAPEHRALRIEYAAPSFRTDLRARPPLLFRSRISHLDTTWTPWTDEPHRDLTNLPDGALRFEVEAQNAAGRISAPAGIEFVVRAPWWRTTSARIVWGLLGIGLVSGVVWGRTRVLRRQNEHLERVVATRTAELERLRLIDRDESAAAKLAEEKTRLEMLRYQLNPHFLYNALNSIRALIFSRPPAAGDMVLQLADLCRVTLTRNEEVAPVSEEFAMLALYLDMEKTRWRDKLAVEIDLRPEAATQAIPPFLLLPLVENALKHGRQSTPGVMKLRLGAKVEANTLTLEVANTGTWLEPGQSSAPSTGIGLENLRQRLKRYYPDSHQLTTTATDGHVVVSLRLAAKDA